MQNSDVSNSQTSLRVKAPVVFALSLAPTLASTPLHNEDRAIITPWFLGLRPKMLVIQANRFL